MKEIVRLTLATAASQVGVHEKPRGSNRGPEVEAYLRSTGLGPGYAWCMALMFYCAQGAAKKLLLRNPLPKTAYCPDLARFGKSYSILFERPEPGDFMLSYSSPEGWLRASHVGIVESVSGLDFTSIEGNTNLDGGREGDGVYRKRRRVSSRYKFVRWNMIAPGTTSLPITLHPSPAPVALPAVTNGDQLALSNTIKGYATKIGGTNYFGVRAWAQALGISCDWDAGRQIVLLQGRDAPLDLYKHRVKASYIAMAPIRQLAQFSGLQVVHDADARLVRVTR